MTLLLLPAPIQELCEGDLGDFTLKVRDMLYGQSSKMADAHVLAPILLVRACVFLRCRLWV